MIGVFEASWAVRTSLLFLPMVPYVSPFRTTEWRLQQRSDVPGGSSSSTRASLSFCHPRSSTHPFVRREACSTEAHVSRSRLFFFECGCNLKLTVSLILFRDWLCVSLVASHWHLTGATPAKEASVRSCQKCCPTIWRTMVAEL